MKILIKNAKLLVTDSELEKADILIDNDVIVKIESHLEDDCEIVIDASGCFASPGFIDIHTHCFPVGAIGLEPDVLGIERWASTIVDAGTAGEANFEKFKIDTIDKCKTRVYSLLNVSSYGLEYKHELNSLDKINELGIKNTVEKYNETIIGLKARASQSVVGDLGIIPIKMASDIAHSLKKSLTVHVGNHPPKLEDVLNCLKKNDIVTHAYHGKPGGILNDNKDQVIDEAKEARERGVLFDIGHGAASFSFAVYKKARELGFDCDLISSDLHIENYNGPVYNLVEVVNKVINCGEELEQAVEKVTRIPADLFGLKNLGEIKIGNLGDIFLFRIMECDEEVIDSMGCPLRLSKKIVPEKLIVSRGKKSGIY